MRCLVVEGDPSRRRLLGALLRRDGHEALEIDDPVEGWARHRADPFDLIVLDGDEPGGLDLSRRIRDQGGRSVVLALLRSTDPGRIGRVLESGASVYAEVRLDLTELETRLRIAERQAAASADRARAEQERERLLDAAQAAQLAAELAGRRFAFLAEASTVLASSLEYETTLARVAELAVPRVADYCIVDLLDDGASQPRQIAAVHVDPVGTELLRGPLPASQRRDSRGPGARALATGRSVFELSLASAGPGAEGRATGEPAEPDRLEAISCLAVPIVARGRAIGAITLAATAESGRVFGPADLDLAEDLARRAGVAVDNVRLYEETQRASGRLRALAWAATEAQTASDEAGVFAVIGAAIVRSGLNVHASLLERGPDGDATLVIQHVALVDEMLSLVERVLGRPIVGIRLDVEGVGPFRDAVRERRVVPVPSAFEWLREALPWMSQRAAGVIGRLRQVSQGMAVPVTDGHEVLGVLAVWGSSLGDADQAALELLGRQAGAALAALRHRAAERERDRLDGALLLARTAAHAINNALGLTSGYAELLAGQPAIADDPVLAGYVQEVLAGVQQAAERVARFQRVIRLEEQPSPLGEGQPLLDLDRSMAPGIG